MADLIERINARLALMAAPPEWADKPVYVDAEPVRTLLREAAAALEAAREDACVGLVADIRFACGDNGKRMQPELVEFIRGLTADAAKWRESGAGK